MLELYTGKLECNNKLSRVLAEGNVLLFTIITILILRWSDGLQNNFVIITFDHVGLLLVMMNSERQTEAKELENAEGEDIVNEEW